ncbi:MAG: beta-ketoacyl synthase N-terminal-like domain-containing protein [Flavobacteriales bacterium]|nr:beta-ketoacyl synthase N-terminal-like domain-containing protein [Flavobacteriales bacterium]
MQNILITGIGSISALGNNADEIWENYQGNTTLISDCCLNNGDVKVGKLSAESEQLIKGLRKEKIAYRKLDKSVVMSMIASRKAAKHANWKQIENTAINIGSSRGATALFEKYHKHYLQSNKRLSPLSSPTTTLGNISSWVAMDLGSKGATLSHSITCSTALHSILNACVWIKSDMAEQFLAGGSEAPLTNFTIAQMQALGIYSKNKSDWPCNPLQKNKDENSMILGEGAVVFALEKDRGQKAIAKIIGLGFATEMIEHNASLSAEAECMHNSMKMALYDAKLSTIDTLVMHAPGTLQGDEAELKAITKIFGKNMPHLISTKHLSGHTLGTSGALSIELAIMMLQNEKNISFPYESSAHQNNNTPETIMINGVGFGGNAVSIILQKA